jgi:nucleoside-diphosphate-sugar epimerase
MISISKTGRIFITGGSGLIGRALAVNLACDGNEVIILSRHPERIIGLSAGVNAFQHGAVGGLLVIGRGRIRGLKKYPWCDSNARHAV